MRVPKRNKYIAIYYLALLIIGLIPFTPTYAAEKKTSIDIIYGLINGGYKDKVKIVNTADNEITITLKETEETFVFTKNDKLATAIKTPQNELTTCDDKDNSYSCLFYPEVGADGAYYYFQFPTTPLYIVSSESTANLVFFNTYTKLTGLSQQLIIKARTTGSLPATTPTTSFYIAGKVILEETGDRVPGIPIHAYKLDSNGKPDKEVVVYSIAAVDSTGGVSASLIDTSHTGESSLDGDIFIMDKNAKPLTPGRYKIVVDIDALSLLEKLEQNEGYAKSTGGIAIITGVCAVIGCSVVQIVASTAMAAIPAAINAYKDWKDGEVRYVGSAVVTVDDKGSFTPNPFTLKLVKTQANVFERSLAKAIKYFGGWVQTALEWIMSWLNALLTKTEDYVLGKANCNPSTEICGVMGPWIAMRNIGLSLLVIALLIIAFANIFQINLEQYGLNRMIPRIIVSIAMASLSWIIVVFFFDFSTMLQQQAAGLISGSSIGAEPAGLKQLGSLQIASLSDPAATMASAFGAIILLLFLCVAVLICGVVLFFLLIARIVMLCFLLAVAPLAFILNIVPFTANLYKQWWSTFFKWMFMGPMAMTIIALGWVIATSMSKPLASATSTGSLSLDVSMITSPSSSVSGSGEILIGLIIFAASLYMAATIPMQWGGKIMGKFGSMGKNLWGKTGGALGKSAGTWALNNTGRRITQPIAGAWKDWRGEANKKRENANLKNANRIRNVFGGGTDPDVMERKLFDAEVATAGDKIGVGSAGQPKLIQRYKDSKNDFEKAAIMRQMAKEGDLEKLFASEGSLDPETGAWKDRTDNLARIARQKAGMELARLNGKDQALESLVMSNQAELFVAGHEGFKSMATKGALGAADTKSANYAKAKYGATLASQKNKTLREKRANIFDDIAPEDIGKFLSDFDKENIGNANVSSSKVVSKYNDFLTRSGTGVGEAGAGETVSQPDQSSSSVGADGAPGGYRGVGEDD